MVCRNGFKEYITIGTISFIGWLVYVILKNYLMNGGIESFGLAFVEAIVFSLVFTVAMFAVNALVEKKSAAIRSRGSNHGKIICEGSATNRGNGGWMFLTENGFEFYPHKVNFNRQSIIINFKDVFKIVKGYNYLKVCTSTGEYKFIICKVNVWVDCINRLGKIQ